MSAADGGLLERWRSMVKPGTVVAFAEAEDPRVLRAAVRFAAETSATPLLVGQGGTIRRGLAELDLRAPAGPPIRHCTAGESSVEAALVLLEERHVDACVVGARTTTARVLRACLATFAAELRGRLVSSSMVLELPTGRVLLYADCAVVPRPTARQLAAIAVAAADEYLRLIGEQAFVALLSASSLGSAEYGAARRMRRARDESLALRPSLRVAGELQLDAALDEAIAAIKAPGSSVAGRANVLIFPDLDAGNIAYKLTRQLAGARAYGPVLNGLPGVVVDLSRGCSTADVYGSALAAAVKFDRDGCITFKPSAPSAGSVVATLPGDRGRA